MDVNLLASAQEGTFAVSAAPSDRHLAIWNLGGRRPKKRKAQQGAAASLAMEQQAVAIAASTSSGEDSGFLVAAAEQSGSTLVWECQPQTDGSVATEIRATLTAPSTYAAACRLLPMPSNSEPDMPHCLGSWLLYPQASQNRLSRDSPTALSWQLMIIWHAARRRAANTVSCCNINDEGLQGLLDDAKPDIVLIHAGSGTNLHWR